MFTSSSPLFAGHFSSVFTEILGSNSSFASMTSSFCGSLFIKYCIIIVLFRRSRHVIFTLSKCCLIDVAQPPSLFAIIVSILLILSILLSPLLIIICSSEMSMPLNSLLDQSATLFLASASSLALLALNSSDSILVILFSISVFLFALLPI